MAAATLKPKSGAASSAPTPSSNGISRAERVVAEKTELYEAAEEFLTLEAAGTPNPNAGVLYSSLNWDPPKMRSGWQRAGRVAALKRRAGTAADREATAQALAAALEVEQSETPKLLAEIERLHTEIVPNIVEGRWRLRS